MAARRFSISFIQAVGSGEAIGFFVFFFGGESVALISWSCLGVGLHPALRA